MSPTIALALCAVYVLALLRAEAQRSPTNSLATWVPTMWMLYCASKPLHHWFAGGPQVMDQHLSTAGSTIDRNFMVLLICAGILILLSRKFSWAHAVRNNSALVMLFTYMLLSTLWSDYTSISLRRWIRAVGAIVMAFALLTELDAKRALESVLLRTAFILIPISLLLIKYYPAMGVEYGRWTGALMWVGVASQKNGLGRLCVVSILTIAWILMYDGNSSRDKNVRWAGASVILISLWLFKGSGDSFSATSVVVLLVGISALAILRWSTKRGKRACLNTPILIVVALVILYGALLPFVSEVAVSSIVSVLGRDSTLTGRTDLWAVLVPLAIDHPLLGFGYASFWINPSPDVVALRVTAAHNGYLEVILDLGVLGGILLLVFLKDYWRRVSAVLDSESSLRDFGLSFMLVILLHNIAESSLAISTSQLWNVFVFISVILTIDHHGRDTLLEA